MLSGIYAVKISRLWSVLISVALFSLALLAGAANAQSWQVELSIDPSNTHYDENVSRKDGPELLGNSLTILPVQLGVTYYARPILRLPFWLSLEAEVPLASLPGDEVGRKAVTDNVVQRERSEHRTSRIQSSLGFELLPEIQPYLTFEVSRLSTRRTNQQVGQDDGSLLPDPNQDYTESIDATYLGFGIMSTIPLAAAANSRIRINMAYLNAQGSSVSNTYFGDGTWGQHTSGYSIHARAGIESGLDLLSSARASYLTFGVSGSISHWNGDGHVGYDLFQHPYWPSTSIARLGAFAGLGVFF
jgi:hypothetical protein